MHDCMIPTNVDKRAKELATFSEELGVIKSDFIDLVKADEAYTGDAESESEIARQIKSIKDHIKTFEQDERDMSSYLRNEL